MVLVRSSPSPRELAVPQRAFVTLVEGCLDKAQHSPDARPTYDSRALSSKRSYLQALLARDAFFAAVVPTFKSTRSQAYFRLMLRTMAPVADAITATEAKER